MDEIKNVFMKSMRRNEFGIKTQMHRNHEQKSNGTEFNGRLLANQTKEND